MYADQEAPEVLDFSADNYADDDDPGPIDHWEIEDFDDMICSAE